MAKRRSEELKRENARIHKNTTDYSTEQNRRKKEEMKYREVKKDEFS